MTDDVIRVVEKHRIEDGHPEMPPHKETWTEIEGDVEEVSEKMAEFLWHELGIDVEEEGIEVIEDE